MTESRFWRSWPADIRIPFLLLLGLALLTIGWSIYEYIAGPDKAIPWLTETFFDSIPLVVDQFNYLARSFQVQASGYLISERYGVGLPVISPVLATLYMIVLGATLVFYLAAITTLKRLQYAIGMLLFMLLLGSFNADALDLVQSTRNYFLIGALIAFGLLTYYFQSFAPNTSFSVRLVCILALVVAAACFIYLRSAYNGFTTSLHLIGHSSPAVLIAGLIFTLLVAFDIVLGLLWLNGQGTTPQHRAGIGRFIAVTLLYLLSLAFIFLAGTGYFQVDISLVTPFFLLIISFIVGLWGFRFREQVLGKWLPYRPAGAFLYLCLGIFAFLGATYAFGTANDPIIEAFNDAVVFTHLALGGMFFIYVLANFGRAILARLPVYRIVFQPPKLPFFTVYTAGGIALLALVMYTGMFSLRQAEAGYYNYLGDLYLNEGNDLLAERYYIEGHTYENNNVRSNLSLAALADKKRFSSMQILFLKRTLRRRPQEKMYVRLANAYTNKGAIFDAFFTTREGLKRYPESHRLHNNMALLFAQTDVLDSMAIYLDRAQKLSDDPLIGNNALALLMKKGLTQQAMELVRKTENVDYKPFKSNATLLQVAYANPADSTLSPDLTVRPLTDGGFGMIYHQLLGQLAKTDTTLVPKLTKLASLEENAAYSEGLNLIKAFIQHYHGSRTQARNTLEELTLNTSGNDGYYRDLLGLWLMEEGLFRAAAAQFDKAKAAGYAPAFMHHAYALSLAGLPSEAENEAKRVLTSGDPVLINQSVALQRLLSTPPTAFTSTTSDTLKAQLLELYRNQLPAQVQLGTAQTINTPVLKAEALANLTEQLIEQKRITEAETTLAQLTEQGLDKALKAGRINQLKAGLLLAKKNYKELLSFLDNNSFALGYEGLKAYYRAVSLWELGRPKEAAPLFAQLPGLLPYHAPAIRETARFYSQNLNEPMKAYELLLSAIAYSPYSAELQKAFALQALELSLRDYAQGALEQLSELVSPAEYATFKVQYDQKLAELQARQENW